MIRKKRCRIVYSAIVLLTIAFFISPAISLGEDYLFERLWPSEVLGLRSPSGVALDSLDNVYIADTSNHCIQKFNSSGVYQTKWGTHGSGNGQFQYPRGIAVDSLDNVYVIESGRIQKFNSGGAYQAQWGTWGTGNGQFQGLSGIAVDSLDNIYVADSGNYRIQKFSSSGIYQAQWGTEGDGNGQFNSLNPSGVAVDSLDNIYVADSGNYRIQKFNSSGIYQAQWGTEGDGNGQFDYPSGIAVDSSGYVYVADSGSRRLQKFDSDGVYQTQWGTFGNGNGQFYWPTGVAVDSLGYVYVADSGNSRIQKFNSNGVYQTQWGTEGDGNGQFIEPSGVAIDSLGYVYVADSGNSRIQKFDSDGVYQTQWGTFGNGNGQFYRPYGIAIDSLDNVYVIDAYRIKKFNSSGVYQTQWGTPGSGNGQFYDARGIAVDKLGYVYVADTQNHRIQKFDPNGVYQTQWGTEGTGNGQFGILNPSGVAVDSLGNVYATDRFCIQKFDSNGVYQTQWGTYGTGNGQFNYPSGITVDSLDNVYVADSWNNRIQKFDSNGTYITQWGTEGSENGQFMGPSGVAVNNTLSSRVYVADTNNHRIQKFIVGFSVTSPASVVPAGSGVSFSVDIFINNIDIAFLYYKKGGDLSYWPHILTFQSGNTWTTTIPSIFVTTSGIAYYIEALDDSDVHYYYGSANSPKNISVDGSSSISAKTTPAGSGNVWNIVGPSIITYNKSILSIFDDYGGNDYGKTWIAWRWNPTSARWEVPKKFGGNPVTFAPFDAGTSWFYAVDGDGSYIDNRHSYGTSIDISTKFTVPIMKGWNLICNPFDFGVAWSDSAIKIKYGTWEGTPTEAEALNYVDNRAIWYNPDTKAYVIRYSNEAIPYVMPKTRGQWLYSAVYGAYVMFYPTASSSPAPPSIQKEDKGLWRIDLILRSSNGTDNIEAIADREAKDISLNEIKPPSLPISVSRISFIRDMTELSSDRQKQSGDIEWSVSIDAPDESLLEWNLTGVNEYKLTLEDTETGRQYDLRQEKNIPIAKGEKGHRYILRANGIAIPKATRLLVNYPNPFNPETWIPYELSEGSEVVIKIYTTTGQLVRTLNLGIREAGYYTTQEKAAHWDGKNEAGEHVSSGIYFYNIRAGSYNATKKMIVTK